MRVALFVAFVVLVGGCSLPPAARREVALLKNEIIDWQNQYYALKSEYVRATGCEPQLDGFSPGFDGDIIVEPPPGGAIDMIMGRTSPAPENAYPNQSAANDLIQTNRENLAGASTTAPGYTPQANAEGFRPPRILGVPIDGASLLATAAGGESEIESTQVSYREEHSPSFNTVQIQSDSNIANVVNISAEPYWEPQSSGLDSQPQLRVQASGLSAASAMQGQEDALQISVLDLTRPSGEQRIGFWSLSPQQLGVLQQRNDLDNAIDLLLPWPAEATDSSQIRLFFRIKAADSRWIEQAVDVGNPSR